MEISYNYITKVIAVTFEDGSVVVCDNKESYLAQFPDRGPDCVAIGWEDIPE